MNNQQNRSENTITEMPDLEQVYAAIKAMYDQEGNFKTTASKWLEELQRSVYAWKISDMLLMKQMDYQSCYFAANTLKSKILQSFNELPVESYNSLKDSITNHIINMNERPIKTQLGLSLAYIVFMNPHWENPIEELSVKLPKALFLEILVCIGQEFDENRQSFKLTKKRRIQMSQYLSGHFANTLQLLLTCFQEASNMDPESREKLIIPCLTCFEAWINFCSQEHVPLVRSILVIIFDYLKNTDCPLGIHEKASDALCKVIYQAEANSFLSELRVFVIEEVYKLQSAFQNAVALEDSPKLTDLASVFSELGISTLEFIIYDQVDTKIIELILNCVSHYDFDVAEITFGFWYNFSDLIRKNMSSSDVCTKFAPFFNMLFSSLTRHCQIEADHEGIIDEKSHVSDYRNQIKDMIQEISVSFDWTNYVKSINLVEHFQPTTPWEIVESHLFILYCIATEEDCFNENPNKNTVLPQIVSSILALPNNPTHVQVYATACELLGELHKWIKENGNFLQPTVGFLITVITSNYKNCPQLSAKAGTALKQVLSDMRPETEFNWGAKLFLDLINLYSQIEHHVELGVPILASCTAIISNPNMEKCDEQEMLLQQLIQLCLSKINNILNNEKISLEERKKRWEKIIDHLHAVFKNLKPNEKTRNSPVIHNCIQENIWVFLKESIAQFAPIDSQVIEHCSRVLRHIVRSMSPSYLLQPIVDHIVPLFQQYPDNSSLLYLGSVLVDEFADRNNPVVADGLIRMLNAFSVSTFHYLNEHNLNLNPYMVDDYFVLCCRVITRLTEHFMSNTQTLNSILNFALMSIYLPQKEANDSVTKFLTVFFKVDYTLKTQYMYNDFGRNIFFALIDALIFKLPGYFIPEIADTIWAFRTIYPDLYDRYLQYTTENLYAKVQKEGYNVNLESLKGFYDTMKKASNPKPLVSELRYLQRLFN